MNFDDLLGRYLEKNCSELEMVTSTEVIDANTLDHF